LKADPSAQLKLLDVQALDSRADQLRHQRANLPEIAEIANLTASRAELNDSLRDMQIAVDDLTAAQKKADRDGEQVQVRLTELQRQVADADERLAELTAERDRRTAEIDAELSTVSAERNPAVQDMPADLLALYDKLRESKNGVGAAELKARQCGGCRLSIDPSELSHIKSSPAELVIRCEECQRILVRTAESGL
jgi:predicted  nucleic acid-binding Zn-ribbon protein